jgi:hypothetical protein
LIEVTLTLSEIRMGALIGMERQVSAIKRGLKNKHGYNGDDSWGIHITGALAEIAVAKSLNMFFRGDVDTFKNPDVGEYQVRYTKTDPPTLIIRDGDKIEEKFICVTGEAPTFYVHGWMQAADARQKQWKRAPNGRPPAYFVPVDKLNDMKYLESIMPTLNVEELSVA